MPIAKKDIDNFFLMINHLHQATLNDVSQLLGSKKIAENVSEILDLRKKYGIQTDIDFNIFTSISEKYHYENFHSDILRDILDPNKPVIGNIAHLKQFLGLLKIIGLEETFNLENVDDIEVTREFVVPINDTNGKLDIVISNKSSAIIIENKINNAPDIQDLDDYVKNYAKKTGKKVIALIYLPLTDKRTQPNTENELLLLPAIKSLNNGQQIDLTHGFLDKVINDFTLECNDDDELTRYIFLKQYSNLLKHLGEEEILMPLQKEILTEVYKNKKTLEITNEIIDLWADRFKLLVEIVQEKSKFKRWQKDMEIYTADDNEEITVFIYPDKDGIEVGYMLNRKSKFLDWAQNTISNYANQYSSEPDDADNHGKIFHYIILDIDIDGLSNLIKKLRAETPKK